MVEVVVGIIRNNSQDVFIAKRKKNQFMPGFWELPGGKVEADEGLMMRSSESCLKKQELQLNSVV